MATKKRLDRAEKSGLSVLLEKTKGANRALRGCQQQLAFLSERRFEAILEVERIDAQIASARAAEAGLVSALASAEDEEDNAILTLVSSIPLEKRE